MRISSSPNGERLASWFLTTAAFAVTLTEKARHSAPKGFGTAARSPANNPNRNSDSGSDFYVKTQNTRTQNTRATKTDDNDDRQKKKKRTEPRRRKRAMGRSQRSWDEAKKKNEMEDGRRRSRCWVVGFSRKPDAALLDLSRWFFFPLRSPFVRPGRFSWRFFFGSILCRGLGGAPSSARMWNGIGFWSAFIIIILLLVFRSPRLTRWNRSVVSSVISCPR